MPTLDQLASAGTVASSDKVLLGQSGRVLTASVGQITAGSQPALTVAAGTLLGRVSAFDGAPETVTVGPGLKIAGGQVKADITVVAPLVSPTLTGVPTAPTAPAGSNDATLATTGFVSNAIAGIHASGFAVPSAALLGGDGVRALPVTLGAGVTLSAGQLSATLAGLDASAATVSINGTTRSFTSLASDQPNLKSLGAVGDGATDDTAAVQAASVSGATVPPGRYATSLSLAGLGARLHGTGRVLDAAGNQRAPSVAHVGAAPAWSGDETATATAFNGDFTHAHLAFEHLIDNRAGGNTLGKPLTGTAVTPAAAAIYGYVTNQSGWNQDTASATGRTLAMAMRLRVSNYGQGDLAAYDATGIVSGAKAGASHFLANPSVTVNRGNVAAGTSGVLLSPGRFELSDGGFDVAGIGWSVEMNRSVGTGALAATWMGYRSTSKGGAPIDAHVSVAGPAKLGIDLVGGTYGTGRAALAVKPNDRLYLNASNADAQSFPSGVRTGSEWIEYDPSNGTQIVVGGVPVAKFSAAGISATGSALNVTSANGTVARSLAARAADRINVLDFGADPTAAVNSVPAFNAAIASVTAGAAARLFVPRGLYRLDSVVASNGRIVAIEFDDGADITGTGYIGVDRVHASQGGQQALVTGEGWFGLARGMPVGSGAVNWIVTNSTRINRAQHNFVYTNLNSYARSGGYLDVAVQSVHTWLRQYDNTGCSGHWEVVSCPPLDEESRDRAGLNTSVNFGEYDVVNNAPEAPWSDTPSTAVGAAGLQIDPSGLNAPLIGGHIHYAFGTFGGYPYANNRWWTYPAIFSVLSPSSVTQGTAITITSDDGTGVISKATITLNSDGTKGDPAGIAAAINAAAIPAVAAAVNTVGSANPRLVIYSNAPNAMGKITLANAIGTPLATLGIEAKTYATPRDTITTVMGGVNPTVATSDQITLNGKVVTLSGGAGAGSSADVVASINAAAIAGVRADLTRTGALVLTSAAAPLTLAQPTGSTGLGKLNLKPGTYYPPTAPLALATAYAEVGAGAVKLTDQISINGNTVALNRGSGTTADIVAAINAAAIPGVTARVHGLNASAALEIRNTTGGPLALANVAGTPLDTLGIAAATYSAGGYPAGSQNGFLVGRDALAPQGRGLYVGGSSTTDRSIWPTAPVEARGAFLHGLRTDQATFGSSLALRMAPGQAVGWTSGGTVAGSAAGDVVLAAGPGGSVRIPAVSLTDNSSAAASTSWVRGQGYTVAANNLSDLPSASAALANLGGAPAIAPTFFSAVIPDQIAFKGRRPPASTEAVSIVGNESDHLGLWSPDGSKGWVLALTGADLMIRAAAGTGRIMLGNGAGVLIGGPLAMANATATTPPTSDSSNSVATTAFVQAQRFVTAAAAAAAAPVQSVNGATGAVSLTAAGLGAVSTSTLGQIGGVATLDSAGHIPVAQLPASVLGALSFQGGWNATTNTPTLSSGIGTRGFAYTVTTGGPTQLDGIGAWSPGDKAVFDGTAWQKFNGLANPVLSVAGRSGAVMLSPADIPGFAAAAAAGAPVQSIAGRTGSVTLSHTDIADWTIATAALAGPTYNAGGGIIINGGTISADLTSVAGRTGAVTLTHADITDWTTAITGLAGTTYAAGSGIAINSGTISANLSSVAGRTGAVTLTHADITDWSAATAGLGGGTSYTAGTGIAITAGTISANLISVAGRTGTITLTHADIADWSSATAGFGSATGGAVSSVAGRTGAITLSASDIAGLGTAAGMNVGTLSGSVAAGNDARLAGAEQVSNRGGGNGYAPLDGAARVPVGNLPAASALSGFASAAAAVAPVQSVNGQTGTVTLTAAALSAVATSAVGAPNGVAALDPTGRVPIAQLPTSVVGAMTYQGTWNANTNSPALTSGTGIKGACYTVAIGGGTTLDGIAQWNIGDHAVFNGTVWEKLDGIASEVLSVAGRTGTVTLTASDIAGLTGLATATIGSGLSLSGSTLAASVATVAGRGGAVILSTADIVGFAAAAAAAAPVQSVAGRTGSVSLTHADITDWASALVAAPVPLGYSAAIATNAAVGATTFTVTLTGATAQLANPTNLVAGQTYSWILTQDGTGGRTLTYGSMFKFQAPYSNAAPPALSTSAGATDMLTALFDGTSLYAGLARGFA